MIGRAPLCWLNTIGHICCVGHGSNTISNTITYMASQPSAAASLVITNMARHNDDAMFITTNNDHSTDVFVFMSN